MKIQYSNIFIIFITFITFIAFELWILIHMMPPNYIKYCTGCILICRAHMLNAKQSNWNPP